MRMLLVRGEGNRKRTQYGAHCEQSMTGLACEREEKVAQRTLVRGCLSLTEPSRTLGVEESYLLLGPEHEI